MREILFRGKRPDNGEWVCGSLVVAEKHDHSGPEYIIIEYEELGDSANVDPNTVGQYTGLKDKNGKKIFQGDVVLYQFDADDCPFPNKNTKKRCGRVFFSEWRSSFSVTANGMSESMNNDLFRYVRNGNRVEVVGNIYDNPEMMDRRNNNAV